MKKVLFANPMVATTGSVLTDFVSNKKSRQLIEDAEKHRRDYDWAMQCERREGKAEGKAEGITIGEARGELRGLLKAKFGAIPQHIAERIAGIQDMVVLESLAATVASCQTLDDFPKGM